MLGTSAGAQNLSAYMCNQQGYARKVITRYTTARQFFDPMRFVRGGNLIDLDWLVETTAQNAAGDELCGRAVRSGERAVDVRLPGR